MSAGYAFVKYHDFAKEPFNPPFARELLAIPSIINTQTLHDPLFVWQRLIVVCISSMLLIAIYVSARKLFGVRSALLSVILFLFEPEILAHGHYAATDMILTCFFFLTSMTYLFWRKTLTVKRAIVIGILMGLTLSVKISAIPFLLGSFILLHIFEKRKRFFQIQKHTVYLAIAVVGVALVTVWGTYFFTVESALGKGFVPKNQIVKKAALIPGISFLLTQPIPFGGYIRTIKQDLLYNYSDQYVKPAFLVGNFSQAGFWYFYLVAFFLKTPLPLILLGFIVFYYDKKKKSSYLLLPILAILVSASLSTLNLGVRYILPLYPFLILYVSYGMTLVFPYKKIIVTFLLCWYILGTISIAPHFISFMNEFAGERKYKFLIDSNYDWGQGLIALTNYQKFHHIGWLQLAYFGMVDPKMYGLRYERIQDISLGDKQLAKKVQIKKGATIAISASCYYYCGYFKNPILAGQKPRIIGGSILLFTF